MLPILPDAPAGGISAGERAAGSVSGAGPSLSHVREVLMILPPDFWAPDIQKRLRFPAQGPAIVAAAIAPDGFHTRAVDLEQLCNEQPLGLDPEVLRDMEALERYLLGRSEPRIEALGAALLDRLGAADCDCFAISLDRHTQIPVASVLAVELQRRHGKPIIIGGAGSDHLQSLWQRLGATGGPDVITCAQTPDEIRSAFAALLEAPRGGGRAPFEPLTQSVRLVRIAFPGQGWPMPDFDIYDLARYRRDPMTAEPERFDYTGSSMAGLVLPYSFTFECQFACAFCQTEATQTAKPMDEVVRDLATMAERWGSTRFLFFDTQINALAAPFSRALLDAKLDVKWSNSFRVNPVKPGDLELMARAGCAALTVGVESVSDRVLKKMLKGQRGEHATRFVREAHALEIMLRVNLLPCFPGETRADFEETRDWLREHAYAIDDIAPSSFCLTRESPVGRNPERFGIRLRGVRVLEGESRFRLSFSTLAYDEIDGMTWEEREPTLLASEEELHEQWRIGRGPLAQVGGVPLPTMLALRERFATKAEINDALLGWTCSGRSERSRASDAPPEPSSSPLGHVPKLEPLEAEPEADPRLDAALRDAAPSVARYAASGQLAYLLLFDDDDYLCFAGTLDAASGRLAIENVLASRFKTTARRGLYGALVPGSTFAVGDAALEVAPAAKNASPRRCDGSVRLASVRFRLAAADAESR